jgi:hypothetical protein
VVPVVATTKEKRDRAATAVLVALGIYFLARSAPSATPDTLAVALACIGLVRVARKGHVDALSAALFAVVPLVEPSCLGVLGGVTVAHMLRREPGRDHAVFAAVFAATVVTLFCSVVSGGVWVTHVVRSIDRPMTCTRFVQELGWSALVLGAPNVAIAAIAIKKRAPLVLTAPLIASIAWSPFAIAKHGSGTQVWLEPTMAAVVMLAFMPAGRVRNRPQRNQSSAIGSSIGAGGGVVGFGGRLE